MNPVNHVTRAASAATNLLRALDEMRAVAYEYQKTDAGNVVTEETMKQAFGAVATGDGDETAPVVPKADFVGAIVTFDAIQTLMDQGHAANLYKLKQ